MNLFTSILLLVAVIVTLILLRGAFQKQFLDPNVRVATDRGKRAGGKVFTQEKGEWK